MVNNFCFDRSHLHYKNDELRMSELATCQMPYVLTVVGFHKRPFFEYRVWVGLPIKVSKLDE